MTDYQLDKIINFVPHSLQYPNAWVGHLPFAAWIIQQITPQVFVELGTHSGNSYFSFCQSAAQANLPTRCYAVDTWQGDEHAGDYANNIFEQVNAYNQEHYSAFSRLLRMFFDDAVHYFSDESIELLHIDGLHTYEAVRHDYETWLPKLAPGAVILFHDTNVRERNFGVWKLWEELQLIYPNNMEFFHSHGLGVIQLNNAPENKKLEWLKPDSLEKQRLKDFFTLLGTRQLERYELNEFKSQVSNLQQAASINHNQLELLEQKISEQNQNLQIMEQKIFEQNQNLQVKEQKISEQNKNLEWKENVIHQLYNSRSWRVTMPMRFFGNLLRKLK